MTQTLQEVTPSYNMKWKYSYEIKIYIERKSFLKLLFFFWQNSLFLFLKWIVNTTTSIAQHYLFISIKNIATSILQHYYITLFPHYEKGIFLVHLYSVGERLIVCVYVVLWWGGNWELKIYILLLVQNIFITVTLFPYYTLLFLWKGGCMCSWVFKRMYICMYINIYVSMYLWVFFFSVFCTKMMHEGRGVVEM